METRIYQSTKNYSPFSALKESLAGYKNSFYLAKQLAKRDISAQYRQSFLGIFWAFAPIIMSAAVWIFLQGTGTIKLSDTGMPYPLYVVIGTTFWAILTDCLTMTLLSVNANRSIIAKINFDKEALITLGFIKLLFNLMLRMILIVALLLFFKATISYSVVLFLPVLFLSMLLFVSMGILLTPIGVLFQDIDRTIPILMQLFMYITPVVYVVPKGGIMKTIMECNPLTYLIINLRNTLTGAAPENIVMLGILFAAAIFLFLFATLVYRISIPIITERMSA